MIAALLCNQLSRSSGPIFAVPSYYCRKRYDEDEPARIPSPDEYNRELKAKAEKAVKDTEQVKKAVKVLFKTEYVPPEIEEAKDIVHTRSLVDELTVEGHRADTDYILIYVMQCYIYYCDWQRQDEEDVAVLLLCL